MREDDELLRRFVRENSQPAFADLVNRHLPRVYSTALRRVGGNPYLAQEAAQHVGRQSDGSDYGLNEING